MFVKFQDLCEIYYLSLNFPPHFTIWNPSDKILYANLLLTNFSIKKHVNSNQYLRGNFSVLEDSQMFMDMAICINIVIRNSFFFWSLSYKLINTSTSFPHISESEEVPNPRLGRPESLCW